jgi:hypothetical protein
MGLQLDATSLDIGDEAKMFVWETQRVIVDLKEIHWQAHEMHRALHSVLIKNDAYTYPTV